MNNDIRFSFDAARANSYAGTLTRIGKVRMNLGVHAFVVAGWPEEHLGVLLRAASEVRRHHLGDTVSFCGIVNARSGACSEDCAFCAQSGHHQAVSPRHGFLPLDEILQAARVLRDAGASRFSIVTSGKRLSDADFGRLLEAIQAVSGLGLCADCSPGILDRAQLRELKAAGCGAYHHNLETGRTFFPRICTTHAYDEDVQAVREAVEEGLTVCSGGIFGLGESWEDRIELAHELRELGVQSVPLNFLHPVPGTPLAGRPVLSRCEALKIMVLFRLMLPDRQIRICGGRHDVFGPEHRAEPFLAGVSGVMVGDYLTLKGLGAAEDQVLARRLGLRSESETVFQGDE
ncbi:MAG: biotin synthase BioB [Desulfovibrio sp.]